MLAGACGHTYGNNNVWQMWAPGCNPVLHADIPWAEALDHPGAFQMGLMRRIFEAYDYQQLQPISSFVVDGPHYGGAKIRAALAEDGSFAFIYSPQGAPFTVARTQLKATRVKEIWFDPRYDSRHHIHSSDAGAFQTYTPPTSGRGNDWLLILDGRA